MCIRDRNITFISYSRMVHVALDAAEQLTQEGIDAEVIDLQTLSPIDKETIFQSVQKTGKCLTIEEDCKSSGFGAEVSALIGEECFDYLDAPVRRIAAADVPVPFAASLEFEALPDVDKIMKTAKMMLS